MSEGAQNGWAITGAGSVVLGEGSPDPTPFLKSRKNRKFMGRQDDLAVIAAGQAMASAALAGGERVGLFLAVGYIPFEASDIGPVLAESLDEQGLFSLRRFGEEGLHRAHPLLTFRCLPNMPAFHVSMNFDIQGPSCVVYPGPGQLYLALEEATAALDEGRVDAALVLGVAHQRNFLVEHHFSRVAAPADPASLRDAAGCLVLERPEHAARRGAQVRGMLEDFSLQFDASLAGSPPSERFAGSPLGELGPASLPASVAGALGAAGLVSHELKSRDGFLARSRWLLGLAPPEQPAALR